MDWLEIRLFGQDLSSLLVHSCGHEPSNELKSVLKNPKFRFVSSNPTASLVDLLILAILALPL